MHNSQIKAQAIQLRSQGKTYAEINSALDIKLPKSTLATWCQNIRVPDGYTEKIKEIMESNLSTARKMAKLSIIEKRDVLLKKMENENKYLSDLYEKNIDVKKIVLSILYIAEGAKGNRGAIMFGNSDHFIISSFVNLLRKCYKIDESKFRCTIQCRADQNIQELESFWSRITRIPLDQFYKARVDKRTIGQISQKKDYKGVCRIDYFSSAIDLELKLIAKIIITKGL